MKTETYLGGLMKRHKVDDDNDDASNKYVIYLRCEECQAVTDLCCNICEKKICETHSRRCSVCRARVCSDEFETGRKCKDCVVVSESSAEKKRKNSSTHWADLILLRYQNKIIQPSDFDDVCGLICHLKSSKIARETREEAVKRSILAFCEDLDVDAFISFARITQDTAKVIGRSFPSPVVLLEAEKKLNQDGKLFEILRTVTDMRPYLMEMIVHYSQSKEDVMIYLEYLKPCLLDSHFRNGSLLLRRICEDALFYHYTSTLTECLLETDLLKKSVMEDPHFVNKYPYPLHAVKNIVGAEFLLANGIVLEQKDESNRTALTFKIEEDIDERVIALFLTKGASWTNALERKSVIGAKGLRMLYSVCPGVVQNLPVETLLPQKEDFPYLWRPPKNLIAVEFLQSIRYDIPSHFIKTMLYLSSKVSFAPMVKCYSERKPAPPESSSLGLVVALFTLNYLKLEELGKSKGLVIEYIRKFSTKVTPNSLPYMNKKVKSRMFTFLLCLNRLQKQMTKPIERDVRLLLLHHVFSFYRFKVKPT